MFVVRLSCHGRFHERDTHVTTCCRHPRYICCEDATKQLLPWNVGFTYNDAESWRRPLNTAARRLPPYQLLQLLCVFGQSPSSGVSCHMMDLHALFNVHLPY